MTNQIKFDAPKYDQTSDHNNYNRHSSTTQSPFSNQHTMQPPSTSYSQHESEVDHSSEKRDYLENPEEVLFLQVFVEEVGIWMDSMDPSKHASELTALC